jgi:hypothetical protein
MEWKEEAPVFGPHCSAGGWKAQTGGLELRFIEAKLRHLPEHRALSNGVLNYPDLELVRASAACKSQSSGDVRKQLDYRKHAQTERPRDEEGRDLRHL